MIHNDDETKLSENKPMFQTLVNRVLLEQEEKNKKSQLKKTKRRAHNSSIVTFCKINFA